MLGIKEIDGSFEIPVVIGTPKSVTETLEEVGAVTVNVGGVPDDNRSVTLFFYNAMTNPICV
jgi:hypothetical protein